MSLSLPRNAQLWLPRLLASNISRPNQRSEGPTDILFCIADHFEPAHGGADRNTERARVDMWLKRYPELASKFRDANGYPPQHTFFFPIEGYQPDLIDSLAELRRSRLGDVEVHLHHENDTAEQLLDRLSHFRDVLFEKHGLLRRDRNGDITFGFIHGNWALDNARPDGKWCGVNSEISVLRAAGCYADFTLPAAPDPSQTRTVNSIYYAIDDPSKPRSHDYGVRARVGAVPPRDGLLIVQGPLMFDWRRRVWGIFPGLENAALDSSPAHLPTFERFAQWVNAHISVEGRSEWVFIKVHAHGAPEDNAQALLGSAMERFHSEINRHFNDGRRYRLHYVTAYEMACLVKAAEAGRQGDPRSWLQEPLI